jgi:hypothetical protein
VRKVRYIILGSKLGITVYIDYLTIVTIVKQDSLFFNNTDKLNLCLIRVSLYLSQFNLDVRYRFGFLNIVFNVLSYFANTKAQFIIPSDENVLEDI